jgi:hypothetical protein
MTRKQVSQLNGFDSREAIWRAIRALKTFTIPQLRAETTMKVESVREYCQGLAAAGYIEQGGPAEGDAKTQFKAMVWQLKRDCGVDAPRVRKDGSPVTQGRSRLQMWRTMKVLGLFTVNALSINASIEDSVVAESDAEDYIKHLCRAGYLVRIVRQGKVSYQFLKSRNTGPKAPMVQRVKQVWDPNLKQVMWTEGEEADGGR